jgi:hypothetical protein
MLLELTDEQIKFLEEYAPKDDLFTSYNECNQIIEKFDLKNQNKLTDLRNAVVNFYIELRKRTGKDYMISMQSVTSVIDYVFYVGLNF